MDTFHHCRNDLLIWLAEGELLDLKTEFVHHQQKLDEYDEVYDRKTAEPASGTIDQEKRNLVAKLDGDKIFHGNIPSAC